jgi:disulfide bond formation protein DsbB
MTTPLNHLSNKLFMGSPIRLLWLILTASVLALAAAFTAEFALHMPPCILCLAQRVPYALAIILAGVCLWWPGTRHVMLGLLCALFLINAGIAAYQVGIEQKLWGLDEGGNGQICTAPNLAVENIKDLYQSMSGTPVGDCAHPAFNFHGITFAVMNVLLSLCLFLLAARGIRHRAA